MKTLLWAIAAIAMAVGLVAAAVRSSAGYVQIVLPPYRVELSLVLVLLVAVFAAAYFGMRLVSAMVAMPRQVREYREARRQQKARDTLMEALRAFFSGRYARAEKAAASAMDLGEQPALAATLAARAAHELRAPERRDGYLTRMVADGEASAADGLLKAITEADLLVKQQRAAEALNVLQALPQKHTAALRLELRALQLEKSWEASVAVIDQLEKRKVYDATQAGELRRAAITQHLKRCATGHATLDDAWRKIPATLQRDARVAAAAAEGYLASNAEDNAQVRAAEVIEQALAASWDSDLAGLYAACNTGTSQIERAERWLAAHPNDATLLLTLGRLCAREKLWGKARNYLDASLSVEPTHNAYLASAQLYEQLGDNDAAQKHYRKSLEQALARLHRANVAG